MLAPARPPIPCAYHLIIERVGVPNCRSTHARLASIPLLLHAAGEAVKYECVVAKLERTRWQEHVVQTQEQLNVVIQEEARLEALLDRMRGNFGAPTRQGYPGDVVSATQASSSAGPAAAAAVSLRPRTVSNTHLTLPTKA